MSEFSNNHFHASDEATSWSDQNTDAFADVLAAVRKLKEAMGDRPVWNGMVKVSPFIPETVPVLAEDFLSRWSAMTAYHIDLSLLELFRLEPCGYLLGDGTMVVHPNNYSAFVAGADGFAIEDLAT